jgi:hypothetical protein
MLAMVPQLMVVLVVVWLRSPRARRIKVLSHLEEVRLTRQSSMIFVLARSRVIPDKIS